MTNTFKLDVLTFHLSNLERACAYVQFLLEPLNASYDKGRLLELSREQFREPLVGVLEACKAAQLPLSVPVQSQARRVLALLDGARSQDLTPESVFHRIDEQARAFRQALNDDLGSHWFWYVPEPERHLMIDSAHFGESVDGRFPTAQEDISSAARCLALREGTACVFHLMRVLEHGLRELARHLEIRMVPTVELENWGNIIDQSESKIQEERKALNKQPKSELKNERLQFLGEIAVQFGYFKDAWRNHVSHARKSYDADQALSVWNHTKEFMQKLASLA